MQPEEAPVLLRFTDEFQDGLRRLARKYRRVRQDVDPLVQSLKEGGTPGDRVPGFSYEVYKVRLPNSSAGRGKSGGFRVIYYLRTEASVLLVTIYSKTERDDISVGEVKDIVRAYEQSLISSETEGAEGGGGSEGTVP